MHSAILLFALPLLIGAAQEPLAPCPTPPAPLPAGLVAWKTGPSLAAATDVKSLVQAKLTVGKRAEVMLTATDTVRYLLTPVKPTAPASLGGMVSFTVARVGSYRVAIGTAAWIDVVKGGKALLSTAHEHGPACSGVRKMVDFKLTPGRYVLQIDGSKDAVAPVLITQLR